MSKFITDEKQRENITITQAPPRMIFQAKPDNMDTSKNRVILASSVRTVHAGLTKYGF